MGEYPEVSHQEAGGRGICVRRPRITSSGHRLQLTSPLWYPHNRYAERAWHALGGKSELSVEEILRLMRKLNMRPTKAYAEEMLRIVDANSDGHLQVRSRYARCSMWRR